MKQNLYALAATTDPTTARKWCGGNLGGDNETCVTTAQIAGTDAFMVGDSKPEGAGRFLAMTGAELDEFTLNWVKARNLA